MPNPSYYFTLFKKFQTLGHVPEGTFHGAAPGPVGVHFSDPTALLTLARAGTPVIGTTTADTPLWMVLNAKAMGTGPFVYNGMNWLPMPHTLAGGAVAAWADIGGMPLVNSFAAWLSMGKPVDIPTPALPNSGDVPGTLSTGVSVFVCSSSGDDGTRPNSTIPPAFWASSLIYLLDPTSGMPANPPTLHAASEFHVAAVIGNRGTSPGGRYSTNPTTTHSPEVQAQAWALVFGTGGASPAAQLPSLSNLDAASIDGIYDAYCVKSGKYDWAGFRFPVQLVFDGLVAAINSAVTAGTFTLPSGVSAEQYLKTPPSHVCLKVAVRRDDQPWPAHDASPLVEPRIAQKNLVVFDTDLAVPSPSPLINWKYFTVGGPLARMLSGMREASKDLGKNTLVIHNEMIELGARVYVAVPRAVWKKYMKKDGVPGFTVIERDRTEQLRVPFRDHVILALRSTKKNAIELPFLDDHAFALALGVEVEKKGLKAGDVGRVSVEHQTILPRFKKGEQCFDLERVTIGGFTVEFRYSRPEKKPPPGKAAPVKAAPKGKAAKRTRPKSA
jgi:hypothetical protein